MFGIVARDNFSSNVSIGSNLAVGGKVATKYISQPTRTITVIPPFDNTATEVNYTLNLNSSKSEFGDLAIVFLSVVDPGGKNVVIEFGSNLYVTQCGGPDSTLDITGFSYFAMLLFFDGEYFVQCNEIC